MYVQQMLQICKRDLQKRKNHKPPCCLEKGRCLLSNQWGSMYDRFNGRNLKKKNGKRWLVICHTHNRSLGVGVFPELYLHTVL